MKLPSLFKTPKHKTFTLRPRYYNAEKEAFEERVRIASRVTQNDSEDVIAAKDRIRQKFRERRNIKSRPENRTRILRIMVLVFILAAIFYWILK